jgi:type IV secretory pathway VirJ component
MTGFRADEPGMTDCSSICHRNGGAIGAQDRTMDGEGSGSLQRRHARAATAGRATLRMLLVVATALAALFLRMPQPHVPMPAAHVMVGVSRWADPTFGRFTLYAPAGRPRGLVLFLSGDGGWRGSVDAMARSLAAHGVLVAGLPTATLLHHVETERRTCAAPNLPLLDLAREIEHRFAFTRYERPVLAGYSAGATLVYGAVAQAPAGSYAGAVSVAFSPDIVGLKPWCASFAPAGRLAATRTALPRPGWLFAPIPLAAPWTMLQGMTDPVVDFATARAFAGRAGAQFVPLPGVDHGFASAIDWRAPLVHAVLSRLERPAAAAGAIALPADLPLTAVTDPTAPSTDLMAVLYSGDGGWAGLDREIAARLAAAGVPVVGVDSLAYFWTAHPPAEAGRDLVRILSGYSHLWHRPRVILIGYSFGADALPGIVGTLPVPIRTRIARIGLIGLGQQADYQFHLGSWLDVAGPAAVPTVPAVAALRGTDMVCIHGTDEGDSACPLLPPGLARDVLMPGGHHLGGDADLVTAKILSGLGV